jgi:hypothetical protein
VTTVDDIQPDELKVTLRQALATIEQCVEKAGMWRTTTLYDFNVEDAALKEQLNRWRDQTRSALLSIYTSDAAALRFVINEPEAGPGSPRANLKQWFSGQCTALLDARDQLRELRARIVSAVAQLVDRLAHDDSLLAAVRDADRYSKDVWGKLAAAPVLLGPLMRLRADGVMDSALWSVVKTAVSNR